MPKTLLCKCVEMRKMPHNFATYLLWKQYNNALDFGWDMLLVCGNDKTVPEFGYIYAV